jgi:hypothetical protein
MHIGHIAGISARGIDTSLRIIDAPPELKGVKYMVAWHPRLTSEPVQSWFRDQIIAVAHQMLPPNGDTARRNRART